VEIVCIALSVYYVVLIARIILSWTTQFWSPPSSLSPAIRVIYDLTEPILSFFRRFIPPVGGLDLSPIFIFIILGFVQRSLCVGL
jgi:YggT family protein